MNRVGGAMAVAVPFQVLGALGTTPSTGAFLTESEALARTGATRDAAHGIASFMAKTRPGFEGC